MGVPITFLTKFNPNQFKIIGLFKATLPSLMLGAKEVYLNNGKKCLNAVLNGESLFARVVIQRVRN
jgi:hypothetical protein